MRLEDHQGLVFATPFISNEGSLDFFLRVMGITDE